MQTKLQTIKRFLEPILVESKYFFSSIFIEVLFTLYVIYNVFFIKKVVNLLEKYDYQNIKQVIYIYFIISLFYFIVTFLIRHW